MSEKQKPISHKVMANHAKEYIHSYVTMERIKEEFFSYNGRLNRLAYFKRSVILVAFAGIMSLIGAVVSALSDERLEILAELILYSGVIPCLVSSFMLGIRRCHDLNKAGWFICLIYVPIVGSIFALYILFVQGTRGKNQYGPDPLEILN